jgi:hypothetical protein
MSIWFLILANTASGTAAYHSDIKHFNDMGLADC